MMSVIFKKRPVILLLVVGVLVLYSFVNYQQQVNYLRDNYAQTILYKERRLTSMFSLSRMLGNAGLFDDLHSQLEDARQNEMIDFYILQYKGKPLWFGSYDGDLAQLDREYTVTDQPLVTEKATFETLTLGQDYKLTLGFGKDADAYVARNMDRFKAGLYSDAIYYVSIVLLVALWAFWDIFKILNKVRSGKGSEVSSIQTRSRESELFVRGFQGYSDSLQDMSAKHDVLERQVLPSLRGELQSGKLPPYDFDCTLVRTDINNFTSIYHSDKKVEFMATINEFFTEVSHIVSRYNGCIHEFVGDEVLFYFKDDIHENSFAAALSALRDIDQAASEINRRVTVSSGYAFTVKSSVAHGALTFGPLLNGFALSGGVLIETVRVLSHVAEKDGTVVYFDSAHAHRLATHATSHEALKASLKGMPGERSLHRVGSVRDVAETLASLSTQSVSELKYHRSDLALRLIVADLSGRENRDELLLTAMAELRAVPMTRIDAALAQMLGQWLDRLSKECSEQSFAPWKLFSSVISVLPSLIPVNAMPEEMEKRLLGYTALSDARAVANVLDVLTHFKVVDREAVTEKQQENDDHRIAANALLFEGRRDLTPKLVKKLRRQLKSPFHGRIASAIFAIGEIAAYHKSRDFVFFNTQLEFQELLKEIPRWTEHTDPQIRAQAERACGKIGIPLVSRRRSA